MMIHVKERRLIVLFSENENDGIRELGDFQN